jgi:hypothetical protein
VPKDKLAAKFKGHPEREFVAGLPARDIPYSEYEQMSDDDKALLALHPDQYELRNEAVEESASLAESPVAAASDQKTLTDATATRDAIGASKPDSDRTVRK